MNTEPLVSQQERVAAALGSILFFLPILMDKKTEFTVLYMKQSFLLVVLDVLALVLVALFPALFGLIGLVQLVLFILVILLAWNAFQGKRFIISWLLENSEKVIATAGLTNWFTAGK